MDYNGPLIMEALDDTSEQDLPNHIRVKRNEPILRQSSFVNLLDSFPRNSWHEINGTSAFRDSTFKGSFLDRFDILKTPYGIIVDNVTSHSRHKRGVLSKNHKKRVKGNVRHAKHRVDIKNQRKKHGVSKFLHRPVTKKTNSPSSTKRSKNIREIRMSKQIDESRVKSRIEKRESENNNLNTNILNKINTADHEKTRTLINQRASLSNDKSLEQQRKEDSVMLPLVHTGKAELRVRIEKIPTNESSFVSSNTWMDRSAGTSPCSIILPTIKYKMNDEIVDINVTNLELVPNLNSIGRKAANNLTVKINLKKLDRGNNASIDETNNSEDIPLYNAESHLTSNALRIENDQDAENEKYDRTNEIAVGSLDEDAKSRAKRNQEITSKRYLQNDKNAKGSEHFEVGQETLIGDMKREKKRHKRIRGNRAVRSVEEIKELAEKLIVKINELQVYVSNHNETLRTRDSCFDKNADRAVEKEPKISLKKDVLRSTSKIAEKRIAKQAALASKRASQIRSGGSRFARGESRTRRRLRRKWGRWMDWSSCSVTCGKGRQIRWRHCLYDCDAETEMEEKACQLPACPPSKFLGIF
ncbi:uncharacterized protein LOC105429001 [Pogonomyrmex barbatus]|uniref:Uncharacterized protein LOC105429001 n=1 Tax=Pogonomyrmex barbatus TaxID=144034 RepID=A0A6I9WC32_9HYME|nr:uncharacterized protein LOC105429001 [Pogonomyrmex barbatus]